MKYFIGVDPDMHSVGLAVVDGDGKPVAVYCIREDGKKDREGTVAMIVKLTSWIGNSASDGDLPEANLVAAVAVESQEIAYTSKQGRNPRSLLSLAPVSGAALSIASLAWTQAFLFLPAPAKWKGQVPKHVHQGRIYGKLGWKSEIAGNIKKGTAYAYPSVTPQDVLGAETINQGDWKHVGDAVGLARWAREEYNRLVRMRQDICASNSGKAPEPSKGKRRKRGAVREADPGTVEPAPQQASSDAPAGDGVDSEVRTAEVQNP